MASDSMNKANDMARDALGASMNSFASATQKMQALTQEVVGLSMDSLRHTTQVFEKMRGARSFEDLTRIQTEFFRESFEQFAQRSQRVAELATSLPRDMASQTMQAASRAGGQAADTAKSAANDVRAATAGLETSVPGKPSPIS